jgi:hypothetical protein
VQTDRQDKSAHSWEEQQERVGTNYIKTKPDGGFSMSFGGGGGGGSKFLMFSGCGSFYHQPKIVRKALISAFL